MAAPENLFKSSLKRGETLYGCWAGFGDPYATEMLATAGFDWLVIDAEHAPNDLRSMMHQLQVLEGRHSYAVIRPPMGEAWLIKQLLDIGVQTLLIPMVENADQARELVRAMRYPPEGIRGSGAALARASHFSSVSDYTLTANDQMCLLVQVESVAGIAALDEILKIEGVDGVFIGPSDLAADMGYLGKKDDTPVQEVIRDALGRIAAPDKAAGILAVDHETALTYRNWGAQFLAVGIDVLMLAKTAQQIMRRWRDG